MSWASPANWIRARRRLFAACVVLVVTPQAFVGHLRRASSPLAPLSSRAAYIAADVPDHKILRDAGATPLMIAAWEGNATLIKELINEKGADVNSQDDFGWTSIRYAVRNNKAEAALALVELGADVDLPSKSGRTPLMSAAGNGLEEMCRGLVNCGADKLAVDNAGLTAYKHARKPALKELVRPRVTTRKDGRFRFVIPKGTKSKASEEVEEKKPGLFARLRAWLKRCLAFEA